MIILAASSRKFGLRPRLLKDNSQKYYLKIQIFTVSETSPPPPPPAKEVIEIKPPNPITTSPIDIKPSKIVKAVENKPTKPLEKIVTVVNVISESSQLSDNKITKPQPFSEVNAIKASTENVAKTPLIISSRVEVVEAATTKLPPGIISKVEVLSGPIASSKIDIIAKQDLEAVADVGDSSLIFGNNIGEPEYEFLSRQPSEFVEETYKVINFKPASSKFILKPRQTNDHKHKATTKKNSIHPTGLVTKLGGTVIKDGTTTIHETSVIGTFISGKYAQVLQSSSHVVNPSPKGKITPTGTLRILKTAAPTGQKGGKRHLEPTPSSSINQETTVESEQHTGFKPNKKNGQKRFKNKSNEEVQNTKNDNKERPSTGSKKKPSGRSNARSSK